MKKNVLFSLILAAMLSASMTGCGGNSSSTASDTTSDASSSVSESASSSEASSSESSSELEVEQLSSSNNNDDEKEEKVDGIYTQRDLEQDPDTSNAEKITVSDSKTIDIKDEGTYLISGTAKNCTIRIEADEKAKIQLVLDNVSITNDDFPAIYVISADKVFVTTAKGESTLTVSGEFKADGDTNTDAVIYSKDDLVLNGTGTLNIQSDSGNGVSCKDDLKITGGTYNVSTELDAFEANDSISVKDGVFNIPKAKDGFHCENDQAEGTITISGGTFTIEGESDGMQATALLQIDGGEISVNAPEGLESTYVLINDGKIDIYSTDDGINASSKSTAYEPNVEINGGELNVEVGPGDTDGIDANGSIIVNGGTINVTAQMSSFDYDGKAEFNGGTIIVNGEEVSEIPQSMMGGGHGGMRGGMRGGQPGGEMPDEMPGDDRGGFGGFGAFSGNAETF